MNNLSDAKNIWVTSDCHFGHSTILEYCRRPFESAGEMNEAMIDRWNQVVKPEDTVYHLGDFTLGGYEQFKKIIYRLNGSIILLVGDHDDRWIRGYYKSLSINEKFRVDSSGMITLEFSTGKRPLLVVMCHYAMRVWKKSHYGSIHLYGHSHGNLWGFGRSMDVGVDTNNYYPYNLSKIIDGLLKIEPHNKAEERKKQ